MGKENKSYRIRTNVNQDSVVNFTIDNTIDTLDILSLSIDQRNTYKLMGSNTGVIAGRVLANGGFGVPNVKVSVFVEYEETEDISKQILYSYVSTRDLDNNGVRYNLLPVEVDDDCHQNIGTFPTKRVLLDNNNWIDVFDKYYSFTTRTNESGDYMIYGVPVGTHTVHMDVDLSDIGILSQKPRDLIYKGYNANMFENMTKFKVDTNIDSLAQVITQDQSVYVYPFWGDTTDTETNAAITRCDMNINYKFEPTCVFMGSVVTDAGENAMGKNCVGGKKQGRMDEMITGEGRIEMIRKTPNGQIEQFSVKGDNNINSDGVWCYQIPMNLDYVMTDEFGKMVMSDNPTTGIPTRARVRFRFSMAESPSDVAARKRARFLVPNNPHIMESDYPSFTESKTIDYEFGTKTKDENFRDLMWNNVYTVKSYIPRLQKSRLPNNLRHLGIKMVNHSGSNNPMPFNNLRIKFNFMYMFMCTLVKVLVTLTRVINGILTYIGYMFYNIAEACYDAGKALNIKFLGKYWLEGVAKKFAKYKKKAPRDDDGTSSIWFAKTVYQDMQNNTTNCGGLAAFFYKLFLKIGCGITLQGLCETDDGVEINVSPGTNDTVEVLMRQVTGNSCNDNVAALYNCVENQLAQDNEVTSFNFYNDWINGVMYFPLWYRRIKKRINGELKKDVWCATDNTLLMDRKYKKNIRLYSTNMQKRTVSSPTGKSMGSINPLINNEETVSGKANDETGRETLKFTTRNDANCYGYQCHKYARSYFKIYKGLVFEKETMLGDRVYYYKPCDYDPSTGNTDLVTLFATDIVLLGSLNDCDMHGIPQFFKSLESTTYNMPPDLLSETYDYTNETNQTLPDENEANEIDLGSRTTEYTGADWGNLGVDQSNFNETIQVNSMTIERNANENEYDNGGLFYGLTCFDSYTKPKSTINLARICELGVSLDESNEIPSTTSRDTEALTPDGFISYDEIYNPDYRSMFATLNSNFLRTKLNPETGMLEYDFNHMYLDNFDGSLKLLMNAKTVNGYTEKSLFTQKANYTGNHNLENSSDTYLNFRYGDYVKQNGKKIYFYENNNVVGYTKTLEQINGKDRQPRYENSFYFYFGLNEGKTAIDKFNTEFFSDCRNTFASDVPYDMYFQGNSWCPTDATDGFIAFDFNIDPPYTITFTNKDKNDVYTKSSINKDKIIFCTTKPDGYEKYSKQTLVNKMSDSDSIGDTINEVDIIPNGRYTIEVVDGYDNIYDDEITFELPRISFVCDVNPFNRKNSELLSRFAGSDRYETYSNIANYGEITEYTAYNVGDWIEQGEVYYMLNGTVYVSYIAATRLEVTHSNTYFYKHDMALVRDIYGYVALSDISENFFKIDFEPIDADFFGNDYIGCSVMVKIENGVVNVTPNPPSTIPPDICGYLGYTTVNGISTFYFGVPYGNQRYRIKVTQMCEGNPIEESKNVTTLNVIVYEDEFKMYINGIDYDLIKDFASGWNDDKLEDGQFKDVDNDMSTFDKDELKGWNNLLSVGQYQFGGMTKELQEISYSQTSIAEVMAICGVLGSDSTSTSTSYTWTDEYTFNAPSTDVDYYTKGEISRIEYTHTIKDGVTLYDNNGNPVPEANIVHNGVYYTDADHIVEAVLGEDYEETISIDTYNVVRQDNPLNNTANFRIPDLTNITAASEDANGNVTYNTYNPNIEYSDLNCMTFFEYRQFIENINEIINKRSEFARQVAGKFRINHNETILAVTTTTKARPVKYLIVGNEEIILSNGLYNNLPKLSVKKIKVPLKVGKLSDINNTKFTPISNTATLSDGYVVDGKMEISSLTFKLPTLTYGEKFVLYDKDDIIHHGDLYYIEGNGEYNEYMVTFTFRDPGDYTMGKYKTDVLEIDIDAPVYKKVYYDYTTEKGEFTVYYGNGKPKHPYYVSVKNDINSIIPPGRDLSNFENEGNNKSLATMFPVHFYNKPLKSGFSFIFAAINGVPAYPKYALADDRTIGWIYTIGQIGYTNKREYNDLSESLPGGTVVYIRNNSNRFYEYTVPSGGETVEDIIGQTSNTVWSLDLVQYDTSSHTELETILYNGYVVYIKYTPKPEAGSDVQEYYQQVFVKDQSNQGITLSEFIEDNSITHEDYNLSGFYHDLVPGLISRKKAVQLTRYYLYDETTRFYAGDKYYIRSSNGYVEYEVEGNYNGVTIQYYKRTKGIVDDLYGYGACYYILDSQNLCCDNDNGNGWVVRLDQHTNAYIYNNGNNVYNFSFSDIPTDTTLTLKNEFNSGDVVYYKQVDNTFYKYVVESDNMSLDDVKTRISQSTGVSTITDNDLYGIYTFKPSTSTTQVYYGNVLDTATVTENWKGVDVTMPGFMAGYLYNGIPADTEKSNIKAEFGGTEIKLYTPTENNSDIYENINVKRLIYSDFPDTQNYPPTYGEFNTIEPNSGKPYQYTELPLLDDNLVYTDGYGDEYREQIIGTLAVDIDDPILSGHNNGVYEDALGFNSKEDDDIKARTFYTNSEGYTMHQSLYYIFDLDYTEYPLYYYDSGDTQSTIDSNLSYDSVNNRYYFKTMPELLFNLDDKNVSHYISKSKNVTFNVSDYMRRKYPRTSDNVAPLRLSYPKDKFFVIACCNNCYTISPVVETQEIRFIYNYNGFDVRDEIRGAVYILPRASRDYTSEDTIKTGIHYVEDLYYLLNYPFTVRITHYSSETNDYEADTYSQVCSVIENTAEHCYIKVVDNSGSERVTYYASAIKINLSAMGTENTDNNGHILDWLHILVQDKSGIIRGVRGQQTGNVNVTEYDNKEDWEEAINPSNSNSGDNNSNN